MANMRHIPRQHNFLCRTPFRSLLTRVVDDVAADPDPLPRSVREVGRPVEGDLDDVARQQLRLQHVQLHERPPQTYYLWKYSLMFYVSLVLVHNAGPPTFVQILS